MRAEAHDVEDLRLVEARPLRPGPRGRAAHHRGREARPVPDVVAGRVDREGERDRDPLPRRGEVHGETRAREARRLVLPVRGRHGEDVGVVGRILRLIARLEAVPRGGDDEDARAERGHDRFLLERRALLATEADVHDAGGALRRCTEARDLLAERRPFAHARARVPALKHDLWIDPDESLAVDRRADHGAHRRPVPLVLAADGALRVQGGRVRSPCELRVSEVDAAVDHRHGLARSGRRRAVGADGRSPPLRRDQRIREVEAPCRSELPVSLGGEDGAAGEEARQRRAGHAPDPQVGCDRRGAGRPRRTGTELDEHRALPERRELPWPRKRREEAASQGGRRSGQGGDAAEQEHALQGTVHSRGPRKQGGTGARPPPRAPR